MLLEIIGKFKHETTRIGVEIQALQKEQQTHYSGSAHAAVKTEKASGVKRDILKEAEGLKKTVVTLGDRVEKLTAENDAVRVEICKEREYISELSDAIKKMRNEIAVQKKDCDSIRKNIGLGTRQCAQLRQKGEKMV